MPTQAKEIFEAQSKSLYELLSLNGLGLYIPPYQRNYGWGKEKVNRLIDDTLHGLNKLSTGHESFTFLGTVITIHDVEHKTVHPIVKSQVPAKVLTVIDGQQRLSSLMLLLVNLHNLISQYSWKTFRGKSPESSETERYSLYEETIKILGKLGKTFYEDQNIGSASIYPRLIRAFVDQWATDENKKYNSPIAHLIYTYAQTISTRDTKVKPADFKPLPRDGRGEGEADLVKRFTEIRKSLVKLAKLSPIEELEDFPPLSSLDPENAPNKTQVIAFQRALFNHELGQEFCTWLTNKKDDTETESILMRLVLFAAYMLNRIALTEVQGKDEDYAFTIFESLNTTGEPLTAFETFQPRVVSAENIKEYKSSQAYAFMQGVQEYLSRFSVGDDLQKATRELLVNFALAENGTKLSKRLPDQRAFLKDTFNQHANCQEDREAYLKHLKETAAFIDRAWYPAEGNAQLSGLPASAMTDTVRLCLAFLCDLKHTIAIAPLVRFYANAIDANEEDRDFKIREFESAIKAITAFSVLWRSSRRGTGNIDSEYRAVMAGDSHTNKGPLARMWADPNDDGPAPFVDAQGLKEELRERLRAKGGLSNLNSYIASASDVPLYASCKPVTRFLLLAAYHDTIEDPSNKGLIMKGRTGISPCFTLEGWKNTQHLTIEHIAPQQKSSGWDETFYLQKDTVHKLGNLVLIPQDANASLSRRPWAEKKVLYAALGAKTKEDAAQIIENSKCEFAQTTEALAQLSRYLPHLNALGQQAGDFDSNAMKCRGDLLLKLAYSQINDWLDLNWPENDEEAVNINLNSEEEDESFTEEI